MGRKLAYEIDDTPPPTPKGALLMWRFPDDIPDGWSIIPWPDNVDFPTVDKDGTPLFVFIKKL